MTVAVQTSVRASVPASRFYRPELDVLRFFAFFSVFLTHGPRAVIHPSALLVERTVLTGFNYLAEGGVYGLCLFFFLSSYLITELLLRERKKTGSIHLKAFYIRRVLRIWPLYYLGVGCALAAPFLLPGTGLDRNQILCLLLFVGYLGGRSNGNAFGVLWSISVEELFYLVWPFLARLGRSRLLLASVLIMPLSLGIGIVQCDVWYNPLAHFLFFASGALCALLLEGRDWRLSAPLRVLFCLAAPSCWAAITPIIRIWPCSLANPFDFLVADISCLLFFLGLYNATLPQGWITRALLYLGRISYGLYVFHFFSYRLVERYALPASIINHPLQIPVTQALTLTLTILLASLSYYYFEKPFLRLKERFTFVKNRDTFAQS